MDSGDSAKTFENCLAKKSNFGILEQHVKLSSAWKYLFIACYAEHKRKWGDIYGVSNDRYVRIKVCWGFWIGWGRFEKFEKYYGGELKSN